MWLGRYERGRADGTREAFAIVASDGSYLGTAVAFGIDRETATAELVINVDNVPSKRVAKKCRFTFEGTLRGLYAKPNRRADGEMWSRLATDPDPFISGR